MWFSKKKKDSNSKTFNSAVDIYNRYKYSSRITEDKYIDPLEYEYVRSIVLCSECIFSYGPGRCIVFKEKDYSDSDIEDIMSKVMHTHYCDYFLIKNFSERDNEDEIAKEACDKIRKEVY